MVHSPRHEVILVVRHAHQGHDARQAGHLDHRGDGFHIERAVLHIEKDKVATRQCHNLADGRPGHGLHHRPVDGVSLLKFSP